MVPWPIAMTVYAYTELWMSTDGWWRESCDRKSTYEARAEPKYVANHREYDYNPESQLHYYLATMAIDNGYDDEVVHRPTYFQQER